MADGIRPTLYRGDGAFVMGRVSLRRGAAMRLWTGRVQPEGYSFMAAPVKPSRHTGISPSPDPLASVIDPAQHCGAGLEAI